LANIVSSSYRQTSVVEPGFGGWCTIATRKIVLDQTTLNANNLSIFF
jgi:hypothetical protein